MSTIDDIVKTEADAANVVAKAQKDADQIRQEGLAAAAKIAEDAQAALTADDAALTAAASQRIEAEDARIHIETARRLAAWQARFDQKASTVADWIVNALLTKGM